MTSFREKLILFYFDLCVYEKLKTQHFKLHKRYNELEERLKNTPIEDFDEYNKIYSELEEYEIKIGNGKKADEHFQEMKNNYQDILDYKYWDKFYVEMLIEFTKDNKDESINEAITYIDKLYNTFNN